MKKNLLTRVLTLVMAATMALTQLQLLQLRRMLLQRYSLVSSLISAVMKRLEFLITKNTWVLLRA